jgi:hypothetical protein
MWAFMGAGLSAASGNTETATQVLQWGIDSDRRDREQAMQVSDWRARLQEDGFNLDEFAFSELEELLRN